MIIKCPHAKILSKQMYIEYGYSYIRCPQCGYTGDVGDDPHKDFYKMKVNNPSERNDTTSDWSGTYEDIFCPICGHHALYFPYEETKGYVPCSDDDTYFPLPESDKDRHPVRAKIRAEGLKVKDRKYGFDAKEDTEEKITARNLISCPMFGTIRDGAELCSKCNGPKMSPEEFKIALKKWKEEQEEKKKEREAIESYT